MPESRETCFVDSDAQFGALLAQLAEEPAIALDTESNSFHAYFERVCLVQLSTRSRDYVIDPFRVDVRPLGRLAADPKVEVVLHAADYDIRSLKRDFGFTFANLFDTMLAAKQLGRPEVGLAALVREQFGVKLAKEHQRSDWGRRPLTPEQLAYASMDTRYLLPLRDLLAAELKARGLTAEARAAFAKQAACVPRPKRFDEQGVQKIRGFRALDAQGKQVARALYRLREERARAADRPPFKVFGDEVIVDLARRRPDSVEKLSGVKGLGRQTIGRDGKAIIEAIAQVLGAAA